MFKPNFTSNTSSTATDSSVAFGSIPYLQEDEFIFIDDPRRGEGDVAPIYETIEFDHKAVLEGLEAAITVTETHLTKPS